MKNVKKEGKKKRKRERKEMRKGGAVGQKEMSNKNKWPNEGEVENGVPSNVQGLKRKPHPAKSIPHVSSRGKQKEQHSRLKP